MNTCILVLLGLVVMAASLEAAPAEEITVEEFAAEDANAVELANVAERGQGNEYISHV
jgi:hypothetical protein